MARQSYSPTRRDSNDLKIPDYLINESKLLPRLSAIYGVPEGQLDYTWSRGNFVVRSQRQWDPDRDGLTRVSCGPMRVLICST